MAETKAAKPRAPRKTSVKQDVKNIVQDVEEEVQHVEEVVKEDVQVTEVAAKEKYEEVKAEVSAEVDKLAGKTVPELRVLHDEALWAESEARRQVHILRQRAQNAVVDVEISYELAVIEAKKELAKAQQWLRQIENALEGEFKDLYGTKYGDK